MRLFEKGGPFMDVLADSDPDPMAGGEFPRVFSERFLYATVGKGDARFILGVADEYERLIGILGPEVIRALLVDGRCPRRWTRSQRERVREAMVHFIREEFDEEVSD